MADTSPSFLLQKPSQASQPSTRPHASRNMLPHVVDMPGRAAAACTGAAGIKLFGKVITTQQQQQQQQPVQHHHAGAGAAAGNNSAPPARPQMAASGRGSADLLEEAARARAAAAEARLPCPRCRSRDTKFCYFNNYNVNQPRHFCRACHRYWTAGGAIRNVPVGSGRRKNRPVVLRPPPAPHAAIAAANTSSADHHVSESVSPPSFTAGFAVPYGVAPFHLAPPSPACTAGGLPETMGQYWWLVAGGAAHAAASNRAF